MKIGEKRQDKGGKERGKYLREGRSSTKIQEADNTRMVKKESGKNALFFFVGHNFGDNSGLVFPNRKDDHLEEKLQWDQQI